MSSFGIVKLIHEKRNDEVMKIAKKRIKPLGALSDPTRTQMKQRKLTKEYMMNNHATTLY